MININIKRQIYLARQYPQTTLNYLWDRIYHQNRPTPFPRIISCFITEACNFNCPMCHVKESRNKNMANLSFTDLQNVFLESTRHFPSFQLTGGEPLLHPDLERMIKVLSSKHLVKGLVTNGLLLEEKAQMLVEAKLDFLAISLDGPDESTQYRRGFVKNSFNKIIKGIEAVKRARGNSPFPNIRLATVVSQINLNNFDKVLEVAEELGVDQWSLSHFFYFPEEIKTKQEIFAKKFMMGKDVWGEVLNKGCELFTYDQREVIKNKYLKISAYQKIRKSKVKISLQTETDIDKYYSGVYPGKRSVCTSPFNQVFIRGNGDVEMCQGYILGNIRNEKLRNLWNNKKAQHFREIFTKNRIMPACFRCCALNIKFD